MSNEIRRVGGLLFTGYSFAVYNTYFTVSRFLLNKAKDISELVDLRESELSEILGNSQNGKLLFEFLRKEHGK